MFYSHEILTSRKYGVATVWLVATLGAKSSTKKVTRKAILGVDLKKACETIMEPDAPMALRLQSSLLYGVSKVFNQQWEYLLIDVKSAQSNIRAMLRSARHDELDPEAGKAHPDQLIMLDDPAFSADMIMALPDLGFDLDRALTPQADTQRSSQSMLSIRGRSGSVSSLHAPSVLGLDIAASTNGSVGTYQLPIHDIFLGSGKKSVGVRGDAFEEDEMIFQDDDLFDFDADGQLRDIPASERESRRAGSVAQHIGSDSAASGRVRKDHEDARIGVVFPGHDADGDFDMNFGDDELGLPDAEPFPVGPADVDVDQPILDRFSDELHVPSSPAAEPSSVSAEAPQRKARVKKVKGLKSDHEIALANRDLNDWQREYLDHMAAQALINNNKKANHQAKSNAFHYVYGTGLLGVAEGMGSSKLSSPLEMFSGDALKTLFTNQPPVSASRATRSNKHPRTDDNENEEGSSPKRPRDDDEVGRGLQDNDNMFAPQDDDPFPENPNSDEPEQSIELERGRGAVSALPDLPSSAIMPWNISASQRSKGQGPHSSSLRHPSRRPSASPLIGRGSALPVDDFEIGAGLEDDDDMVLYGRSDRSSSHPLPGPDFGAGGVRSSSMSKAVDEDEFELFGVSALVDTQTAGTSQWVSAALDRESENFYNFIKTRIDEKSTSHVPHAEDEDEDELSRDDLDIGRKDKVVTFEELFDPEQNTCMVAAQAFYHVLTLATKRRVWVEQDEGIPEENKEVPEEVEGVNMLPWGEIRIGVCV